MATIADLIVGLSLNTGGFDRGLAGATASLSRFTRSIAGIGAIGGVGAALGASAAAASRFGHQMAEIATLLPDGVQVVGELRKSIADLSKEFGKVPAEEASALYEIISAGAADAATATNILTVANKLAVGGVTDVATAADGLTTVVQSFGEQIRDATQVSDAFFVAAAAGKTTIAELSREIGYVAPLAAQAGVRFEEVTSAIGALTKGGLRTALAVRGIRQVIADVIKPSSQAAGEAQRLGLQFNSAALASKGLAGFLKDVNDKTKGSSDSLALLFGNVEALTPVLALTGNAAGDFAATLEKTANSAGATDRALATIDLLSPQLKFDRLKATIVSMAIDGGDKILNVLLPAVEGLRKNLDNLVPAVKAVTLALGLGGLLGVLLQTEKALTAIGKLGAVGAFLNLAAAVRSTADAAALLSLAWGALAPILIGAAVIAGLGIVAKGIYDISKAARQHEADTKNLTGALTTLNVKQLESTASAYASAIAFEESARASTNDLVAKGKHAERLKVLREQLKLVTDELLRAQQAGRTGDTLPTVVVTGRAKPAGGDTADPAENAKALQKWLEAANNQVNNLRTNFDLVLNNQAKLNGLGERYLEIHTRLGRALRAQSDQLGDTATQLRKMLADLDAATGAGGVLDIANKLGKISIPGLEPVIPSAAMTGTAAKALDAALAAEIPHVFSPLELAAYRLEQAQLAAAEKMKNFAEDVMPQLAGAIAGAITSFASARGVFGAGGGGLLSGLGQIAGAGLPKLFGGTLGKWAGSAFGGPILGAVFGTIGGALGAGIQSLFGSHKKRVDESALALQKLKEAADRVSASLTNVPSIFKVEGAIYAAQAAKPIPIGGVPGSGGGSPLGPNMGGGAAAASVYVESLYIDARDRPVADVFNELMDYGQSLSLNATGTRTGASGLLSLKR